MNSELSTELSEKVPAAELNWFFYFFKSGEVSCQIINSDILDKNLTFIWGSY